MYSILRKKMFSDKCILKRLFWDRLYGYLFPAKEIERERGRERGIEIEIEREIERERDR